MEPSGATGADELTLEIPTDSAHLATARLFAAAVARHMGVREEDVQDVKAAVSEACGLSEPLSGVGRIVLRIRRGRDVVWFRIEAAGRPRGPVVDADDALMPSEPDLGPQVLLGLFKGARIQADAGGTTVTFGVTVVPE